MKAYWTFARQLLATPWTLVGAVSCAVVSGLGIAAGLGAALPVLDLMLGEDAKGLAGIARDHNAKGAWLQVPEWLLARLPRVRNDAVQRNFGDTLARSPDRRRRAPKQRTQTSPQSPLFRRHETSSPHGRWLDLQEQAHVHT